MTPGVFTLDCSFWSLPLWLILLGVLASLMLGHEVGVRLGRRANRAVAETDNDEGVQAYLTAVSACSSCSSPSVSASRSIITTSGGSW